MHSSVMDFLRDEISPKEIQGKDILEVGSQDINGTPRTTVMPHGPKSYVGVDSGRGKCVDILLPASDLVSHFGAEHFDMVISTEMLEHAEDWRAPVNQMKRVLKPEGILVVTTRGPGFQYHGFPNDFWRFTTNLFCEIFIDMEILVLKKDPLLDGVFLKAKRPKKSESYVDLYKIEAYPIEKKA